MLKGLQAGRNTLKSLWSEGVSGGSLLQRNSKLVDDFILRCFTDSKADDNSMALVAVGGYGRGELFPFSDIDLLLLYRPSLQKDLDTLVSSILYPLWDTGLEIGHSVRTVEACMNDINEDFYFQVALLDMRLVAGSSSLVNDLRKSFAEKIEGRQQQFYNEMQEHRQKRYEHFGAHSYLLEPNIKESCGGARDIQAMLWTSQVVLGLKDMQSLQEAGLLTAAEKTNLEKAWEQLIRIRNRLHYTNGRKNDRLYFEHQEEIAKAFGYKPGNGMLAVERFMRDLYQHMKTVSVATDLFFEHVREVVTGHSIVTKQHFIEDDIEIRHDRIYCSDSSRIQQKPSLMMRIFYQAARNDLPVHYRTKKTIHDHLYLVDAKLRKSKRMSKLFLKILLHDHNKLHALNGMLETGMLSAYIPEFSAIESFAQHDIYHIHTVDYHLLQTVAELHKLEKEENTIFQEVIAPELLFLSGLLHDIGKGRGGGHAEKGAELAHNIGKQLGLDQKARDTLSFLVGNHLLLTKTALRRDLEDEKCILDCAETIKSSDNLAMLFLLSIADARATGPTVWNDWKAALLYELYLKISHLLERTGFPIADDRRGEEWMRHKLQQLVEKAGEGKKDLSVLPTDYLLSYAPEVIFNHLNLVSGLASQETLLYPTEEETGLWSLLLLTKDQPGLLAKICGVLALHNLKVLVAQIFTWQDGTVVDQLMVSPMLNEKYADKEWTAVQNDLLLAVHNRLGLNFRLHRKLPPLTRTPPTVRTKDKIIVDNNTSMEHTVIEVFAQDRPGLLYEITKVLADFNINIFRAKIANEAERAIDAFYVQTSSGDKIIDSTLQEEIRQSLLFVIAAPQENNRKNISFL